MSPFITLGIGPAILPSSHLPSLSLLSPLILSRVSPPSLSPLPSPCLSCFRIPSVVGFQSISFPFLFSSSSILSHSPCFSRFFLYYIFLLTVFIKSPPLSLPTQLSSLPPHFFPSHLTQHSSSFPLSLISYHTRPSRFSLSCHHHPHHTTTHTYTHTTQTLLPSLRLQIQPVSTPVQ